MESMQGELNADLFQPEEVDRFADPKEARKKAMDYLARREYGRDELVRKLNAAGFERVTSLTMPSRGLPTRACRATHAMQPSFVQSRINQGKGPVRMRQELTQRGLSASAIDDAIAEADADWVEGLARQVRVKKFGSELPADFPEKARQMRFLQYRGFDADQVEVAVSSHGDDPT